MESAKTAHKNKTGANMIFNFPPQDRLGNYNVIQVFFKNSFDKPIRLLGKVLTATDDGNELILETDYEYATFMCSEIAGIRFGKQQ